MQFILKNEVDIVSASYGLKFGGLEQSFCDDDITSDVNLPKFTFIEVVCCILLLLQGNSGC